MRVKKRYTRRVKMIHHSKFPKIVMATWRGCPCDVGTKWAHASDGSVVCCAYHNSDHIYGPDKQYIVNMPRRWPDSKDESTSHCLEIYHEPGKVFYLRGVAGKDLYHYAAAIGTSPKLFKMARDWGMCPALHDALIKHWTEVVYPAQVAEHERQWGPRPQ